MRCNTAAWENALAGYQARGVFAFAFDPELPGSHLRARMFAPALGVVEDPATGSACAALGGYLGAREADADGQFHWVVEQGFEMGRPSLLELDVEKRAGVVTKIEVGGASVLVSSGTMDT
jgi:trans-2,3-dihydro-3-hydroxyanthranilate isomerase